METITTAGRLTFTVDFGGGREADLELPTDDSMWIATEPGIKRVDVWVKGAREKLDLRVRIERTMEGLTMAVDRGEENKAWWPAEGAPRLSLAFDPLTNAASASASAGIAPEFKEAFLGQVQI